MGERGIAHTVAGQTSRNMQTEASYGGVNESFLCEYPACGACGAPSGEPGEPGTTGIICRYLRRYLHRYLPGVCAGIYMPPSSVYWWYLACCPESTLVEYQADILTLYQEVLDTAISTHIRLIY